ncbi:MAG: hypothetical protein ACK4KW_15115, partial [Gemmobacter sp.]
MGADNASVTAAKAAQEAWAAWAASAASEIIPAGGDGTGDDSGGGSMGPGAWEADEAGGAACLRGEALARQ